MNIGRSHTDTHTCTVCDGTGLQIDDYHGFYAQEEYADMSEEDNWAYQGAYEKEIYCQTCDGKGYVVETYIQIDGEDLRLIEEFY